MNIEETAAAVCFQCPVGVLILRRPRPGEKPELCLVSARNGIEETLVLARVQRNAELRAMQVWVWAFGQLRTAEVRAFAPWWKPWKKVWVWWKRRQAQRATLLSATTREPTPIRPDADEDTPPPVSKLPVGAPR